MALIEPIQGSFAGGEYSPSLYPRTDIDKYRTGLRTCRNFVIHPQGGASNRCGFEYIDNAKYSSSTSIVQEFIFNSTQAYALEFGHHYVRFYTNGIRVEVSGVPYEVATTYEVIDLPNIRFESSADVIWITHPSYKTKTLTRYGSANWVLADYSPEDGPFMPENIDDSASLSVSALTGSNVTLTVAATTTTDTNIVLLLPCNGIDASTAITDTSSYSNTMHADANAQIDTAQSKFGGASLLLDSLSGVSTADNDRWNFGTGDFTVRQWVRFSSITGTQHFVIQRLDTNNAWVFKVDSGTTISFQAVSAGSTVADYTAACSFTTGRWYFVVLQRNGTNIEISVDGVQLTLTPLTAISTNSMPDVSSSLCIGARYIFNVIDSGLNGWIDDFAIIKGRAQYTSYPFSVPTTALSVTTTSTGSFGFDPLHVGALFKLRHYIGGPTVSQAFTGATTSSSIRCFTTWRIITHGTWTGKFSIEKSSDGGATWTILRAFSSTDDFNANTSGTEDIETNTDPFLIRINMYSFTSGTANIDLTSDPFFQEGILRVTSYNSLLSVQAEVLSDVGSTGVTTEWAEGSWSEYRGYPTVARFFQDRLGFANTRSEPQTGWLSKTGNYSSFIRHFSLLDTDGISVNLPSRQINAINGLIAFKKLLGFTSASVWSIGPITTTALTPTSVQQDVEEYTGSSNINQVVIGTEAIYVDDSGEVIKNIGYQLQNDGFIGNVLNVLATHLFEGYTIVKMAYQKKPNKIVWCLRDDGVLLSLTYMREQEVIAWAHHDTDGIVESICVVPGTTADEVWAVINRDNGRFIEKMIGRKQIDISNHVFLDSYTTVQSSTHVVSHLGHLANQVVNLLGDDVVLGTMTVSSTGTLGLTSNYSELQIGIPFNADLETLSIDVPLRSGSMQGGFVKIGNVTFRLSNTRGGYIGPNENDLYEAFTYQTLNTAYLKANKVTLGITDNFSGDVRVPLGAGYEVGGRVFYRQSDPLPVTIGAIIPEIDIGGKGGG